MIENSPIMLSTTELRRLGKQIEALSDEQLAHYLKQVEPNEYTHEGCPQRYRIAKIVADERARGIS